MRKRRGEQDNFLAAAFTCHASHGQTLNEKGICFHVLPGMPVNGCLALTRPTKWFLIDLSSRNQDQSKLRRNCKLRRGLCPAGITVKSVPGRGVRSDGDRGMEKRMPPDNHLTQVLARMNQGQPDAMKDLLPLVYDALRRQAREHMRRERPGHTLQTTALVHEAFIRLTDGRPPAWEDSRHFYAAASAAMRKILVDHARARSAAKRGGDRARGAIEDLEVAQIRPPDEEPVDLEAMDDALTKLQALDERRYQVVMHRYFAGLSEEQTAAVLGVAVKTVQRDWKTARIFLHAEMSNRG